MTIRASGILSWTLAISSFVFLSSASPDNFRLVNPVMPGADPFAFVSKGIIWIYPTWSPGSGRMFYAFSSSDLLSWQRHGPVLEFANIRWIEADGEKMHYAWAPCIVERNEKFYFYYSVGPQGKTPSRLGVAIGNSPAGIFVDSGQPLLIGGGGFEAIDPMVFEDPRSGHLFLYAGGSAGATLRMFALRDDMVNLEKPMPVDTPPQFTEGVFIHYHGGKYHLTYSHGSYRHASYSVHYATGDSPTGPWTYRGPLLLSDSLHKGPGHHSFIQSPLNGEWLIFYHRWDGQSGDGPYHGSRQICIDRVSYDANGLLRPISMTDGRTITPVRPGAVINRPR